MFATRFGAPVGNNPILNRAQFMRQETMLYTKCVTSILERTKSHGVEKYLNFNEGSS